MPVKKRKRKKAGPRGSPFAGEKAKAASAKGVEARRLKRAAAAAVAEGRAAIAEVDNTAELLALIEKVVSREREDVELVLRRRAFILRACSKYANAAGNRERMRKLCRLSARWYIDLFVWQYNPLKKGAEVGPMVLWDFQRDALLELKRCYDHDLTAVLEKSREQGASWLLILIGDHDCRFNEWRKWLVISRLGEAVDSPGDMDALFQKLDFMDEHLPWWLRQTRRASKERQAMKITYPATRSAMTGQATSGKAGVGGRCSAMIIDEFSLFEEVRPGMGALVRQRTASTGNTRYFNGTHQGTGTEFYRLTQTPEVVKIRMHWSQHPDKNQGMYSYDQEEKRLRFWQHVPGQGLKELRGPTYRYQPSFEFDMTGAPTGGPHPGLRSPWYDQKCKAIGNARRIAQELDIDPKGSKSKPFDPHTIHRLKQLCRDPDWEGDLVYDDRGWPLQLVEQPGGPLKLWCKLVDGKPVPGPHFLGADISSGTGATPSCASMGNGRTGEKVARYANAHINPDRFGLFCAALCRLFQTVDGSGAKAAWEHAGPGVQFFKAMTEQAGYWNIYRMGEEDEARSRSAGPRQPGFRSTGPTKNGILLAYNLALGNGEYCNYDEEALEETLEFQYDATGKIIHAGEVGADPSVARENHGDTVIADALSCLLMLNSGKLVSRQKPAEAPARPEENVLCMAGRQRLRRQQEEDWE